MSQNPPSHSPIEQMLQALRLARTKIESLQKARDEAIAVVGIGCRFPLAATPAEFWAVVRDGVDATCDVPADRPEFAPFYDADPGRENRAYTRRGGFLRERPDRFDADFFGISEREAEAMDPQQRLLLEVTWEALEDAAIPADSLRKTATGVFLGLSTDDYHRATTSSRKPETFSPYGALGTARSVAAGRISFVYGFQGPCVQVDTACSSSLVAVHLACQSLRSGESAVVLAAGVNLVLSPISTIGRCRLRALAPDGRCKTFDASADGYGQGEGCGVLVLKRVSDALRDGNRIYGVVRGSAVNHDGPSAGLTTPNELAQEQLLRRALANAKVEPAEVQYVEAHGTGTVLGDPIEVNALAAVFRQRSSPLWIGSVKSNMGHAEAAAGMACLIKTLLALRHRELPPNIHFRTPNPHIDWPNLPVKVVTERMPWPDGRRLAGVSAFGLSGTNAHLVLEESPAPAPAQVPAAGPHLLCLSAKTADALYRHVRRLAAFLRETDLPLADICATANRGRNHWEWRLAVVAETALEMAARLEAASLPTVPAASVGDVVTVSAVGEAAANAVEAIAECYRNGATLLWTDSSSVGPPVSLPTYPFARKRYWSQAIPPIRPETPAQALLDRGDVHGLCTLLGVENSGESRRLLEVLTARYLGREAERTYQLQWEPAGLDTSQTSRSIPWTVTAATGVSAPSCLPQLRTLLSDASAHASSHARRGLVCIVADAEPADQAVAVLAHLQSAGKKGMLVWVVALGEKPGLAAAVGLGRGAALDMPNVWRGWIQLPSDPSAADLRTAAQVIQSDTVEPAFRISNGQPEVLRLRRRILPTVLPPLIVHPGDQYLITGGTGAVGQHLARWLVDKGATQLVLTGRRGAEAPCLHQLRARGVEVRVIALDSADATATEGLIAQLPRLRGVIHAAGIGGLDPLPKMSELSLLEVLRPKVAGAWNLHLATQALTLDFFLLCSSIASVWGSKGQAHYAAGNRYLDSLAAHRRSLGLPAVSINWGPWAGTLSQSAESWLLRSGISPISPSEAFASLDSILMSGETQVTVANVDWNVFLNVYEARGSQPLMHHLRGSATRAAMPAKEQKLTQAEVVSRLRTLVSRVLGGSTTPDPAQGFADLGLDSLMAVELKKLVEESFGRPMPATVVFNYPSVNRLAAYLMGESGSVSSVVEQPAKAASSNARANIDVTELLAELAREVEEPW